MRPLTMIGILPWLLAGCAGDQLPMGPGELVDRQPPDVVTGTVLAADSFVVQATQTDFTVQAYSNSGALIPAIGPSAGRLLVLSLWDQSRPDVVCVGGVFNTNCALLVVFPSLGSLSLQLDSGRRVWHLQSNFTLDEEPEPG